MARIETLHNINHDQAAELLDIQGLLCAKKYIQAVRLTSLGDPKEIAQNVVLASDSLEELVLPSHAMSLLLPKPKLKDRELRWVPVAQQMVARMRKSMAPDVLSYEKSHLFKPDNTEAHKDLFMDMCERLLYEGRSPSPRLPFSYLVALGEITLRESSHSSGPIS